MDTYVCRYSDLYPQSLWHRFHAVGMASGHRGTIRQRESTAGAAGSLQGAAGRKPFAGPLHSEAVLLSLLTPTGTKNNLIQPLPRKDHKTEKLLEER